MPSMKSNRKAMRKSQLQEMQKRTLPSQRLSPNELLAKVHKQMLTPVVLKQAQRLPYYEIDFFKAWVTAAAIEFLPEGVPYKLSSTGLVRDMDGCFVEGVNKPLITVSDLLDPTERRNVARHELIEWERQRKHSRGAYQGKYAMTQQAHNEAEKTDNPRLRKSILEKNRARRSFRGFD